MKKSLEKMYIDWFNDFLTVQGFADYYNMPLEKAKRALALGRKIHLKRFSYCPCEERP